MFRFTSISALISSAVVLSGCGGGGGCASSIDCVESSDGFQAVAAAVSVSIGSGDKIETTAKDIKYAFRYAITVSDAQGRPVMGALVNPKVEMVGFYKGQFFRDSEFKVIDIGVVSPATGELVGGPEFCENEDLNSNFELDAGEDLNGDDFLTPEGASVVATVEGSNSTDSQGIVYFRVEYTKSDANWLVYQLTASAAVAGTEGSIAQVQRTNFGIGDDEVESAPFLVSRFGVTPGCDNSF